MKTKILAVTAFIIAIIAVASIYGGYNLLYMPGTPSPTATPTQSPTESSTPTQEPSSTASTNPSSTTTPKPTTTFTPTATPTPEPTNITITDGTNRTITLAVPVEKIISINSGLTQMLCALGVEDKLIGRDESSTLPSSILNVTVVGGSSYDPNVEVILELEPDIIFADSMLTYNDGAMSQLETAGIPIFISDTSDPEPEKHSSVTNVDFSCDLIRKIASIVGGENTAEEYIRYVQYYNNLVKERVATLTQSDRLKVMLEWYAPYNTFVTPALDQAGGINIAENQTTYGPVLSAEFVMEQNPDIIIRMIASTSHLESDFKTMRNEILGRAELSEVNAVKNKAVYICDWEVRGGIYSVVGYLYWAKWCQPDLFADIDPNAVMAELNEMFFDESISGVYVYP